MRAPSSSPVPRSSGCATASRSSTTPRRPVRWPNPSMTPVAWSSSRHSPGSRFALLGCAAAARSSASPEALAGPNSFGPRSRQWPTKPAMSSTPWRRPAYRRARSPRRRWSVGHGFPAAVPGRPARRTCHPISCRGRRRSVRPTWPALPRWGLPCRCHRKLGGRWRVHPDHRPGAPGCRLRPLAASGRAQRDWELEGGVEAGQRPRRLRTA